MTTDKLLRKTIYANGLFIKVSDAQMRSEDKQKHQMDNEYRERSTLISSAFNNKKPIVNPRNNL